MKNILTVTMALAALAAGMIMWQAPARATVGKDSIAVLGMYTPIRFHRGDLDDIIPDDWNLEFFSKEREGLHRLMQGLFNGLLKEDVEDLEIVEPATFERLSLNIYRKVYRSFQQDPNLRFDWTAVEGFCKLLNVRYALFGDVTKFDYNTKKRTANIEMFVYIYDTSARKITFTAKLTNNGALGDAYSYNSLRRLHRKMDTDIVNFLTTEPGRGAMIIYEDFLAKLESSEGSPLKGGGEGQPGGGDHKKPPPGRGGEPVPGGPKQPPPGRGARLDFDSAWPCKGNGASLVLTTRSNDAALLTCKDSNFQVVQVAKDVLKNFNGELWPALGEFEIRGRAMLALSPMDGAGDDVMLYGARGAKIDFNNTLYTINDVFGAGVSGALATAGDLDGDKKDEIILTPMNKGGVAIYKIKSGAVKLIEHHDSPFSDYDGGIYAAAGDFNGDGVAELALSKADACEVVILTRADDGKLDTENPTHSFSDIFSGHDGGCYMAAGDFDGDGSDELVVTEAGSGDDMAVFKNVRGKFRQTDEISGAIEYYSGGLFPAAGDFDGDGADELVLTTATDGDEAHILKFIDGKFNIEKPMAVIKNVFTGSRNGIFAAAGPFAQLWLK